MIGLKLSTADNDSPLEWTSCYNDNDDDDADDEKKLNTINVSPVREPFLCHMEVEPRRKKSKSEVAYMRMLKTPPFLSQIGGGGACISGRMFGSADALCPSLLMTSRNF